MRPRQVLNGLEKASGWSRRLVFGLFFAFAAFMAVSSFLYTCYFEDTSLEVVHYKGDTLLLNLLVLVLAFAAALLAARRRVGERLRGKWPVRVVPCAFLLVLGGLWVLLSKSVPYAEPAAISQYAIEFSSGDWGGLAHGGYYDMFPYQLGFTAYVQLVYLIFGSGNYVALQLLNVGFVAGSGWLLYRLCGRMFGEEGPFAVLGLFLIGSGYLALFTTFTYGTLPGLFFALLALDRVMACTEAGRLGAGAAAIGCAWLAVVMKSNYLIFAVGIGLYLLANAVKEGCVKSLVGAVLVFVVGFGAMQPVYLVYGAVSGQRPGGGVPMAVYVAMGLEQENWNMAPGWYNGLSYSVWPDNDGDPEGAKRDVQEALDRALGQIREQPGRAVEFFYKKTLSQWNEPTYQAVMLAYHSEREEGGRAALVTEVVEGHRSRTGWLVETAMDKVHLLMWVGVAMGLFAGRKKQGWPWLLPALIVVGGLLFHMAWEAKSQYILPYAVLCLPYAAFGWQQAGWWLAERLAVKKA